MPYLIQSLGLPTLRVTIPEVVNNISNEPDYTLKTVHLLPPLEPEWI